MKLLTFTALFAATAMLCVSAAPTPGLFKFKSVDESTFKMYTDAVDVAKQNKKLAAEQLAHLRTSKADKAEISNAKAINERAAREHYKAKRDARKHSGKIRGTTYAMGAAAVAGGAYYLADRNSDAAAAKAGSSSSSVTGASTAKDSSTPYYDPELTTTNSQSNTAPAFTLDSYGNRVPVGSSST